MLRTEQFVYLLLKLLSLEHKDIFIETEWRCGKLKSCIFLLKISNFKKISVQLSILKALWQKYEIVNIVRTVDIYLYSSMLKLLPNKHNYIVTNCSK